MRSPKATLRPALVYLGSRCVPLAAPLGFFGLLLLVLAQGDLRHQQLSATAVSLLVIGVIVWVAALAARDIPDPAPALPARTRLEVRPPLLAAAVGLGAIAWWTSGDGVYTATNVATWLGALVAWCLAWWPRRSRPKLEGRLTASGLTVVLALAAVVALAAYFRFHTLSGVPPEPTSDHADWLLDVRDIVRGQHSIFFLRNNGREPAQLYFVAALVKWFGAPLSWQTLKVGDALVGVLAVPAIFLFAREVAGSVVGVAAAGLAAVSKWPVGLDRDGLRFPYAILGSALTLWLLFRYLQRRDPRDALLLGLALAFGLHGYSPFRVTLIAVPIVFGLCALAPSRDGRASRLEPFAHGLLALATTFVASIPLAHYTVQHPDLVFQRMTSRLDAGLSFTGKLAELPGSTSRAVLAFDWRGDLGWTVSVVGDPLLDPVTAGALLAGVVVVLWWLLRRRSVPALALVLVTPALVLSSALSFAFPNENPSANRLSPVAPVVFLLAALPVGFLWNSVAAAARARPHVRYSLAPAGLALLLGGLGVAAARNYASYFHTYRDQYRASAENTSEVVAALRARGANRETTYLIGYPYWLDGRNVALGLGDLDWYIHHAVEPGQPLPVPPAGTPAIYLLDVQDVSARTALARRFPRGRYERVRSREAGKDFGLYVVPASRSQ